LNVSDTNGSLYLVSTPIGNLEDISMRAIRILGEVDIVAAEDTRRTGLLLSHYNIKNRLESYHDHNKVQKTPFLLKQLSAGQSIAVVSDAGTPGISDPAYYLVRHAIDMGISPIPVPGATAVAAALVVSGLPTDRFVFEGFLPHKKGRQTKLRQLAEEPRTIVLYESPHRLLKTLSEIRDTVGDRQIALCRELTKKFEEIVRGTISEVVDIFSKKRIRGEFVLIIKGKTKHHDKKIQSEK